MESETRTKVSSRCAEVKADDKAKQKDKEAPSRQDWEGGGSRPAVETVPPLIVPKGSPAKNLQKQADSVPKTNHGDGGPPKNHQSLPTQDTKEIKPEPDDA